MKAAELRGRIAELEPRLEQARMAVQGLQELSSRWAEALRRSREAYWNEVGRVFRGRDLGSPRDYMPEIHPREPRTLRSFKTVQPVISSRTPLPAVRAVPSSSAMVAVRGSAFASRALPLPGPAGSSAANPEDFRRQLSRLAGENQRHEELSRQTRKLMIETEGASARMRESLELGKLRERERTLLSDQQARLNIKLQWIQWELGVRSRRALGQISGIGRDWAEGKRWEVIRRLWCRSLRSEALGNSAYAQIKLAYDLAAGDLQRVPSALKEANDPEVAGLVSRLEHLAEIRGKEFIQNLYQISEKPLPGQEWIEKLLKGEFGKKGEKYR